MWENFHIDSGAILFFIGATILAIFMAIIDKKLKELKYRNKKNKYKKR